VIVSSDEEWKPRYERPSPEPTLMKRPLSPSTTRRLIFPSDEIRPARFAPLEAAGEARLLRTVKRRVARHRLSVAD
jgi:hypothetical protein